MGGREIQGHRREFYGIDASPDPVSAVADAVLDERMVRNKAIHVAFGVGVDVTRIADSPSTPGHRP